VKISITLPSIHPEHLALTLDSIGRATTTHDVEVLVVSPFPVEHPGVVWIRETESTGCVAGHAAAYGRATGDLITAFADDHDYAHGWDDMAVTDFLSRATDKSFSLGLRQISATPRVGTVFAKYYPYFPLMRRADVATVGGWFDTRYTHGFSDPDLGLRVWQAGGCCEWADHMSIIPRPENDARRSPVPDYLADLPRFVERWGATYGAGWNLDDMRSWNVDRLVSELA
jgi:hypothetical protein